MLRPLGLGEILDRAVTLCVRHFWLFCAIFVVYAVPLAILQYFGTVDQTKVFGPMVDILQAQSAGKHVDPDALSKAFASGSVLNGWTVGWIAAALFVAPLPAAALIDAASVAYLGGTVTFSNAYRVALGRWAPLIGVNVLYLACGLVLYIIVAIVAFVLILGLVFIVKEVQVLGVILSVIFGVLFTVALIGFALLAALAFQISYFSCVVEKLPFITAFSRGISRVFVGVGLRRSLLVALAYVAIFVGIGLVALIGQSVLFGLLKSNLAGTVYVTIVRVATAAFTTAFLAIFYFDLRVRGEGLDLQVAAGEPLSAT